MCINPVRELQTHCSHNACKHTAMSCCCFGYRLTTARFARVHLVHTINWLWIIRTFEFANGPIFEYFLTNKKQIEYLQTVSFTCYKYGTFGSYIIVSLLPKVTDKRRTYHSDAAIQRINNTNPNTSY